MTLKQLTIIKNKWQKWLRLRDWEIEIKLVRERDMRTRGNAGEITYNLQHKTATMAILDNVDREGGDTNDHEYCIVHEMLHLLLPGVAPDSGTLDRDLFEQGLNMIAGALLNRETTND